MTLKKKKKKRHWALGKTASRQDISRYPPSYEQFFQCPVLGEFKFNHCPLLSAHIQHITYNEYLSYLGSDIGMSLPCVCARACVCLECSNQFPSLRAIDPFFFKQKRKMFDFLNTESPHPLSPSAPTGLVHQDIL